MLKRKFIHIVNKISETSGILSSFLIFPIVCFPSYEVIVRRYILNQPTIWTQEFTLSLFAVYFLIGSAYTIKTGGFVAMDILYNHFKGKKKIASDIIIFISIFFFCGVLIFHGSIWAWESLLTGERSGSLWNPIVWPVRIMVPIGAILVILQAFSNFLQIYFGQEQKVVTCVEPHTAEGDS